MVRDILVLLQYMDPLFLYIRMNKKEECLDLEQIYFTQEIGKINRCKIRGIVNIVKTKLYCQSRKLITSSKRTRKTNILTKKDEC